MKSPWPTKKLGEACEIISPGIKEFECSKKYVATADVDCDKITNFTEITYKNRPIRANIEVKENDILVARMAETKKFLMADKNLQNNYIFSTGFAALRVKEELIPKYLFYFLNTKDFNLQKDKLAVGATQKAINNPALKKIKIPIPTLNIQRKIVERLDAIKKAQELNDKQIELAEELFQSLLHRELDPKGKNWEVKKLGEVFYRQNETVVPAKDCPSDNFNYIGLENIESNSGMLINFTKTLGENIKSSKFIFRKEDILYGKLRPYLNKVWLAEFDGICSTDIWVLRSKQDCVLPLVLANILRSKEILMKTSSFMTGSNLPRVRKDYFDSIKMVLPPLEIQQKIVEKLSAVQEYKKKLLDQKQKLQELFESVLNKSFKGELVG
jgi:restriction endonuclease S subunit